VYALERERLFGRAWQVAGLTAQVEQPGSYFTATVGDRELIVARDAHGRLRAFHNVCPHRASRLLDGCGSARLITCPYHAWTFRLDGSLHRARGMEGAAGFDPSAFGLFEVAVDVWEPFVFLTPDPAAAPLADYLGELPALVRELGVDLVSVARRGDTTVRSWTVDANWKIVEENALECMHCAVAHPTFAATVELRRLRVATFGQCSVMASPARSNGSDADGDHDGLAGTMRRLGETLAGPNAVRFHFVFPNFWLSVFPGYGPSFSFSRHQPQGPRRTEYVYTRFWPEELGPADREESMAFIWQTMMEDKRICENVQRGMESGAWRRGPLALTDFHGGEGGIQHFGRLVGTHLLD
jgi:choline monooxygenase